MRWHGACLSGQYPEGRRTFEDILLTYPGTKLSDPIFWGIVKAYLGADEVEKAMLLYQRFLSYFLASPWVEQSLYDIGQYYFGKKEYTNAASTFRQFLRTYPRVNFTSGFILCWEKACSIKKIISVRPLPINRSWSKRGGQALSPKSFQNWLHAFLFKKL